MIKPVEENKMQVFSSEEFGEIRTAQIDGEPWFVAADVCNVLDIENPRQAVSRLDEDEKLNTVISNDGNKRGNPNMTVVNEPGLYSLILGSRKPEAKAFKRWITHEVIPTIRKTGGYVDSEEMFVNSYFPTADEETKAFMVSTLRYAKRQNKQIAVMQPKAEYFDDLVDRNTLTSFRDTAKEFGVKPKEFLAYLIDHGYVYRDGKGALMPYAEKNDGLFSVRECRSEKNKWSGVQTLITPKGRETFRLLYARQ